MDRVDQRERLGDGGYNANAVVVLHSPKLARLYTREFELMYTTSRYHGDKPRDGKREPVAVGDASGRAALLAQDEPITRVVRPLIQQAKSASTSPCFFLTHTGITTDLIAARRRGDGRADHPGRHRHPQRLPSTRCCAPQASREGGGLRRQDAHEGRRHPWRTVIVGSMNWTWAGEGGNDENTLIIRGAREAKPSMPGSIRSGSASRSAGPRQNPDPESRDSGTACTDGTDNDFDGLADGEVPAAGARLR
ncbi:MAG: hypothetical protein R3F43_17880 [bacterium]